MNHAERFSRLHTLLFSHRALWAGLPFRSRDAPWGDACPGLAEALLALPDDEAERLHRRPFEDSPLSAWLPADFAGFCRWAAVQKQVALPAHVDWAAYETAGWRRLKEVTRLELVRHLFRRPLEVWLALDRVCFLEQAGYEVFLGVFCERALTPRNLVIKARRANPTPPGDG